MLEDAEVVGQQVRADAEQPLQVGGGGVGTGEPVDDAQPRRLGERRVQPGTASHRVLGSGNYLNSH